MSDDKVTKLFSELDEIITERDECLDKIIKITEDEADGWVHESDKLNVELMELYANGVRKFIEYLEARREVLDATPDLDEAFDESLRIQNEMADLYDVQKDLYEQSVALEEEDGDDNAEKIAELSDQITSTDTKIDELDEEFATHLKVIEAAEGVDSDEENEDESDA
jgi:hypothetical protein